MKDEIKSIIDKYTGKTIDDIPDRYIDGQTLEIRKLILFIKSGSLLDNTCEKHTDFVGDVCPVCLMNERDALRLELKQVSARLLHADKEIERLNTMMEVINKESSKQKNQRTDK